MTAPLYAIGDIHGQIGMLTTALERIAADGGPQAEVVFLGDYTDRGPDSRAVLDLLIGGRAEGRPWHMLKGNHDRMFARFLRDGTLHDACILSGLAWTHERLGGLATLASYGVDTAEHRSVAEMLRDAQDLVPAAHLDFLESLPLVLERDGLLFVHAGIRPGLPLDQQSEDDLIWIRDPFLDHADPHPWLVVHGHTALDRPRHFGNRIDLDGGAGYGNPILPAVFEDGACWLLEESGRVPLTP